MVSIKKRIYSVSKINKYISDVLASEPVLEHITIEGEVSNLTYHSSGHIYFDIKDEKSKLSVTMFRGDRRGLSFDMKKGDSVLVTGSIRVYMGSGSYRLYAKLIEPAGEGELYAKYLKLKKELEETGMFDESYKQRIPGYVKHLGIVTAPTGAAVRDIIRISLRRNPFLHITLYPALVQGEAAAASISEGIRTLDAMGVDVIIAGRGGGSIEDLWAFNEEEVARAIFSCSTPIISAVGHETDTTIADFVADMRAATPSEAAELVVTDISGIYDTLDRYRVQMYESITSKLNNAMQRADYTEDKLKLAHPARKLTAKRQMFTSKAVLLKNAMERRLEKNRHKVEILAGRLDGVSPAKKLAAGYSYMSTSAGKSIRSVKDVKEKDTVTAYVTDGKLKLTVDEVVKT